MNEILRFNSHPMRNEEYFQHKLEIIDAMDRSGIKLNPIKRIVDPFKAMVEEIDNALELIRKSGYTEQINNQDNVRDSITRGFIDVVTGYTNHFDSEMREYARILKIITDHYKGINQQSISSQTASTINMLQDLRAKSDLLDDLGLTEWVDKIEDENDNVAELMMARFEEGASLPAERMKELRPECEKLLEDLYKAIEVYSVTYFEERSYSNCIELINVINKKYMNVIAQRKGIAEAGKEEEPEISL